MCNGREPKQFAAIHVPHHAILVPMCGTWDVGPDAFRRVLSALALAVLIGAVAGADWPHVRGPAYDGTSTETGLADAWPAGGPLRLWERTLGQGYSGFVVAEGRLFTQRQSVGGQYLVCLDPNTGETVWEYRYHVAWQPGGAVADGTGWLRGRCHRRATLVD